MENKILEIVIYSILIITIIINTVVFIKDLTKAINRNEEKLLKINRILKIKEDLD